MVSWDAWTTRPLPLPVAALLRQGLADALGVPKGMDAEEHADELRRIRRIIAGCWPEGEGREKAMRVLDEMVWEAHTSTAGTE